MRFVAFDVETANPNLASICQVGVVSFEDGSVAGTSQQLINPEDYFDPWNVSIHGITERKVKDAPNLPNLFTDLKELLDQQIVICHTSFDRVALDRVLDKYGLPRIDCPWLDSAKVVRRAWFSLAQPAGLWTVEEEHQIVCELRELLRTKDIIGQNFLYDAQYIARHWGLAVIPVFDTMLAQGVAWPRLPKALDFLSSMYLRWHRYWKDESQEADDKLEDSIRWRYNCKDCCTTWALHRPLENVIDKLELWAPFTFEMSLFRPLLMMMLRGVRINANLRGQLMSELIEIQQEYESYFEQYSALLPSSPRRSHGIAAPSSSRNYSTPPFPGPLFATARQATSPPTTRRWRSWASGSHCFFHSRRPCSAIAALAYS